MESQPHGRRKAIEYVWRQPDTLLTVSEKQSIAAALAKGTDDTATSLFVAPFPEQWVGALMEFIAGVLPVYDKSFGCTAGRLSPLWA